MLRLTSLSGLLALFVAGAGCGARQSGNSPDSGPPAPDGAAPTTGTPVEVTPPAAVIDRAAAERASLAADRPADTSGFLSRWPARFQAAQSRRFAISVQ